MKRAPNRIETLRTLRVANLDVAFSTAFGTLVGGAFLVGFIQLYHGSDLWIGVLGAIPSLLGILQIPGAIWGRSFSSYKKFVWPGGFIWRCLYLPLVALPFLPISPNSKLVWMAVSMAVATVAVQLVNPIYTDWLAELVPAQSRGAFFSKRNAISTGVGATVGILGGVLLDSFRASHHEAVGLSVIFACGVGFGFVSFFFFMKMTDSPRSVPIRQTLGQGLIATTSPFRDRAYRPVLLFIAAAVFSQGFPGALFAAFALEKLKLSFTAILVFGAMQSLGIILSSRFWGFTADRYGNKPMLAIAGILLAFNPLLWAVCRDGQPQLDTAILLASHLYFGVSWGGINLCQFNIMLSTAPEADRANYIGAGAAVGSLVGGIAPLAGSATMAALRVAYGPSIGYRAVFLADVLFRVIALFFLFGIREAGSERVSTALAHLRSATPVGVRALRQLGRSGSVVVREQALEDLAEERFAMASDAMIQALSDPLPRVRRSAAFAIARLRDPSKLTSAADAIVDQLLNHPELVEEEAIDALGSIGHSSAIEPLIALMISPRSNLRRAAARALGTLGDKRAIPALVEAVGDEDGDFRRVALHALRRMGARGADDAIVNALSDPRPSVRIAAAETLAELEISAARPVLAQLLSEDESESASAMAYALGAVGEPEDAAIIAQAAARSPNSVARRLTLLGLARLMQVESEVYRFMLMSQMDRDTAVMESLRMATKRHKRLGVALNQYSSGQEAAALGTVAALYPELSAIAEFPSEEAFLIAAAVIGRGSSKSEKGP